MRKNKRSVDWEYVDRCTKKRKEEGKESHVFHNGKLLPKSKVRKEIGRYVSTLQQVTYKYRDIPRSPDGFQIVTPCHQPSIMPSLAVLPILQFQEHVQNIQSEPSFG